MCHHSVGCLAEPGCDLPEQPIPVPIVHDVNPPTFPNANVASTSCAGKASTQRLSSCHTAKSLSVSDVNGPELALALGAWMDTRPWDGIRHNVMKGMLQAQAGESVWREPVLQAAALLRQQAGTPVQRPGTSGAGVPPSSSAALCRLTSCHSCVCFCCSALFACRPTHSCWPMSASAQTVPR
jgi:hypothetical protein